jgi:hypothetical protein
VNKEGEQYKEMATRAQVRQSLRGTGDRQAYIGFGQRGWAGCRHSNTGDGLSNCRGGPTDVHGPGDLIDSAQAAAAVVVVHAVLVAHLCGGDGLGVRGYGKEIQCEGLE